jgi:hypothetical protein
MLDILISPFAKIIGVIVLIGALFGAGYYKGYSGEKQRFDTFKADIEAQVKAQEAINEATKKQQDIIGKSIRSDYENKLSALKSYYSGVFKRSNSNELSSVPSSTFSINESSTDSVFTGQCAQTTLMLVNLQEWITEVSKTNQ